MDEVETSTAGQDSEGHAAARHSTGAHYTARPTEQVLDGAGGAAGIGAHDAGVGSADALGSSDMDPRVKAALDRIADSAGVDINQVPELLSDVYRRLNAAMSDPEGG